jgi:hypothetical protein
MDGRDDQQGESTVGPWVLGIVLLALVVWVASLLTEDAADTGADTAAVPVPTLASSAAFSAWVRDSAAAAQQTLDAHAYVTAALRRMALAIGGVVGQTAPALAERVEDMSAGITRFAQDSSGVTAGAHVRTALSTAASILADAAARQQVVAAPDGNGPEAAEQPGTGPEEDAPLAGALAAARTAAAAVDADLPVDRQLERIDAALHALAGALDAVSRTAGMR